MAFAVSKALHIELEQGIRKLHVYVEEAFNMDGADVGTVKSSMGYMSIFRRSDTIPEAFNEMYKMDQKEFLDHLLAGTLPGLDVEETEWGHFSDGRTKSWYISVTAE